MALLNMTGVSPHYAEGVPGRLANGNPHTYTALNTAAGGTVNLASFVWPDAMHRAVNSGTGEPLGFVTVVMDYPIENRTQGVVMTAKENDRLTILRSGEVWAACSGTPAPGHKVFADLATGAVSTAAAGTSVPGAVETSFTVKYAAADGLFIMSNLDPVQS